MRQTRLTAALLLLLILLTACSQGAVTPPRDPPGDPPASPSQAPVTAPNPAPANTGATSGAPGPPVLSDRRAVYLAHQTNEAQYVMLQLGSQAVSFAPVRTGDSYIVIIGEKTPDRNEIRLELKVNRADATVTYLSRETGKWEPATRRIPPVHPAIKQADDLLGKGEVTKAIELLTAALKEQPEAADLWNLLSYAHLQRKAWLGAADAGARALQLDPFHPYALYNTGIAQLELKRYETAIFHLADATEVQPDRAEPYLGLARAYMETGRYMLAYDSAAWASNWAPGSEAVMKLQEPIRAMVQKAAPPDLKGRALARLEDGPFTISLVPGEKAVVYLEGPSGLIGLPVGRLISERARFTRIDLPGGGAGYLLAGEPVGAHVAHSSAHRLFIRSDDRGGDFRQVLFLGSDEGFTPRVSDLFRAGGARIEGERLVATYGDDASGTTTIKTVWLLALLPREPKALHQETTRENRNPNK